MEVDTTTSNKIIETLLEYGVGFRAKGKWNQFFRLGKIRKIIRPVQETHNLIPGKRIAQWVE